MTQYGELSLFGGISQQSVRTKELFSVWIDIPPLKEIAWRALLYYSDNLKDKTDEELARFGLTLSYIRRLRN